LPFVCGVSSPSLDRERAGDVFLSAFAELSGRESRSLVYWFRPTRPRRAGGRPVFLCEGLGRGGSCGGGREEIVGKDEGSAPFEDVVRERGSSEGSESENILAGVMGRAGRSVTVTAPPLCTALSSASCICSLSFTLLFALTKFFVSMIPCCSTTYFLIPTFT